MAVDVRQVIYLVFLLFSLYGCVKSINVYKAKRQFKYLVMLAFFIIVAPQLWMRAYDIRTEEFLATFQFVLTLVPLGLFLVYDYWERKRIAAEKDRVRIKTFFERYVSPKVIEELLSNEKLELKGHRSYITVFFMDIRGFTKMSEKLSPEKVVEILNRYFDIATSVLFRYDGTVDKFVGDAVMAVFNAPTSVRDHELKALKAAMDIQSELKKWGKVSAGIGIHCGECIVGNIGSKHMMDYTAIGDTVNTAARLEGQTDAGDIIVSADLYEKVKSVFVTKHKESVSLKGKSKPVTFYRFRTFKEDYKPKK